MAHKPATLTKSASLLLDMVRLCAALLVVVAHLSRPEFAVVTEHNLQFLGDLAVPVFFVLSGFVIRFVTVSREHTLRVYLIDRASRIYSIALPAMLLTLVVAATCYLTNRPYFEREIAPLSHHALLRVTLNLTFLGQVWGYNTVQFADTPFWSLSYECLFYLAYALILYLRGARRWVAMMLLAIVAGPQIVLLFPVWLLGCALYDIHQAIRQKPIAAFLRKLTLFYAIVAIALAAVGRRSLLLAPLHLEQAIAALPNPLTLIHQGSIRATMLAVANGTSAAVAMLLLLLLTDLLPSVYAPRFARRFRRLADGTFSIYLMHYPLMMLARSVNLLRPGSPVLDALTVTSIVLVLIAIASPLDSLKTALRRKMREVRLTGHPSIAWLQSMLIGSLSEREPLHLCLLQPIIDEKRDPNREWNDADRGNH